MLCTSPKEKCQQGKDFKTYHFRSGSELLKNQTVAGKADTEQKEQSKVLGVCILSVWGVLCYFGESRDREKRKCCSFFSTVKFPQAATKQCLLMYKVPAVFCKNALMLSDPPVGLCFCCRFCTLMSAAIHLVTTVIFGIHKGGTIYCQRSPASSLLAGCVSFCAFLASYLLFHPWECSTCLRRSLGRPHLLSLLCLVWQGWNTSSCSFHSWHCGVYQKCWCVLADVSASLDQLPRARLVWHLHSQTHQLLLGITVQTTWRLQVPHYY